MPPHLQIAPANYLTPPNERPAALLPPMDRGASDTPNSGRSVRAVYANGIEFIDQMSTINGMFAAAMWGMGMGLALFVAWAVGEFSGAWAWIGHALGLFWALVFLAVGRADSVGWRYQPVLFDKAAQKVHVFTDLGSPWWEVWRLLGGTRCRIDSFDWACARGEVAEIVVMGGANLPRKEYALTVAITDAPGSRDVIARFGVGFTAGHDNGQTQVARWEHIRRYMRGESPALTPGDALYPDDGKEHWIGAFTSGQPLLGPGSKVWWTGEGLHGAWFLTVPFGLAFLLILPLTLPYSLIRWTVRRFKGQPCWPEHILASVGNLVDPHSLRPRPNARYMGDYGHPPKLTFKQRRAEENRRKRNVA